MIGVSMCVNEISNPCNLNKMLSYLNLIRLNYNKVCRAE